MLKHTISKRRNVSVVLRGIHTARSKRDNDIHACILGSLLNSRGATKNYQVGKRHLLDFIGRVKLLLNTFELQED
jgi:hypothetical protein